MFLLWLISTPVTLLKVNEIFPFLHYIFELHLIVLHFEKDKRKQAHPEDSVSVISLNMLMVVPRSSVIVTYDDAAWILNILEALSCYLEDEVDATI